MFQGIFVDGIEANKKLAELMSTSGRYGLKVKFHQSADLIKLAKAVLASQPDLVALDYHLGKHNQNLPYTYTATPLAQLLRDTALETTDKDFPIILVSHQDDLKAFSENVTAHNLFDRCFTKEDLGNGSTSRLQILSLVKGYKQLIKNWNKPERWSIFLALTQPEKLEVAYQAIRELDNLKAPHQVAQDILRYVIDRRGILLDEDNVLAELGVAKAGKDVDKVLDILHKNKVMYTGIFSEGWKRWWQHRLEDWGKDLCGESLGNMTAKERVSCLNKKLNLKLSPAKSRWQNHTDALLAFACDSCHQPTEDEFTVIAYDPLPYTFIHHKYICWKCIETGEYKKQGLEIDDGERFIVEKIQNGEIRGST
jgi:hypothetical protein